MAMTPLGYGRFIGRVGGLAVALGIGVAIAAPLAIANPVLRATASPPTLPINLP